VHLPSANSLKLIDYSGDLPLGVYGAVYQDVDCEVVPRTLVYQPGGQRTVEDEGRLPREVLVLGERFVGEVLATTRALASPMDVEISRDLEHAVWSYRLVRNCVQSTLGFDEFARAAKE